MEEQPKLAAPAKKLRTVTGWTILFMVLLRVAIGWHFFYEGVWKLRQDDWRATSYLVMSMGPLRNVFRSMVDDVDGLQQLTPEGTNALLENRYAQLVDHYNITDKDMLTAIESFKKARSGAAEEDPAFNDFAAAASNRLADLVYADFQARPSLAATSQPAAALPEDAVKIEIRNALASVPGFKAAGGPSDNAEAAAAVNAFLTGPGYRETLAVEKQKFVRELRGVRMGYVKSIFADPEYAEQIQDYVVMVGMKKDGQDIKGEIHEFEEKLGTTAYNKERLLDQYQRKAKAKAACTAVAEKPLRDLDAFTLESIRQAYLAAHAGKDAKADQVYAPMVARALPKYTSPTWKIDWANMIALTAVGACLVLGLFTRLAALGGIGLLMLFYWAMPSLPWLPEAGPMEGHYLFINKNIIEALALAMIATSGVGRWAGLDAFLFRKRRLGLD